MWWQVNTTDCNQACSVNFHSNSLQSCIQWMYSAGIVVGGENANTSRHCTISTTILSNACKPTHFSGICGLQADFLERHTWGVEGRNNGFHVLNPRPETTTVPKNKESYFFKFLYYIYLINIHTQILLNCPDWLLLNSAMCLRQHYPSTQNKKRFIVFKSKFVNYIDC